MRFTLAQLLAAVTSICFLLALLAPSIQMARENARANQCRNNLHSIGIYLQTYHDNYLVFPPGASCHDVRAVNGLASNGPFEYGWSWWHGIEANLGFSSVAPKLDSIAFGAPRGIKYAVTNGAHAGQINSVIPGYLVENHKTMMRCPASPLPLIENPQGPYSTRLPTYVGISGGGTFQLSNGDMATDSPGIPAIPRHENGPESWLDMRYSEQNRTAIFCVNGMLTPNEQQSIATCSDGTSNVMIVGEQSDYLLDANPQKKTLYHGDPGWNPGSPYQGWLPGSNQPWLIYTPDSNYPLSSQKFFTGAMLNVTSVRYAAGNRRVMNDTQKYPGVAETFGYNNPLQSAHPGKCFVALADASVQLLSTSIDHAITLRLAIRNDGVCNCEF